MNVYIHLRERRNTTKNRLVNLQSNIGPYQVADMNANCCQSRSCSPPGLLTQVFSKKKRFFSYCIFHKNGSYCAAKSSKKLYPTKTGKIVSKPAILCICNKIYSHWGKLKWITLRNKKMEKKVLRAEKVIKTSSP